jgi:hypothetical protein
MESTNTFIASTKQEALEVGFSIRNIIELDDSIEKALVRCKSVRISSTHVFSIIARRIDEKADIVHLYVLVMPISGVPQPMILCGVHGGKAPECEPHFLASVKIGQSYTLSFAGNFEANEIMIYFFQEGKTTPPLIFKATPSQLLWNHGLFSQSELLKIFEQLNK